MASIVQRGTSWRALVRKHGQSLSRSFDTQKEAQDWADGIENRIKIGATKETITKTSGMATVSDMFLRYAEEISPNKKGEKWEVARLKHFANLDAFQIPPGALDGPLLAQWRDQRLKEVQPATVIRDFNLISSVFSKARKEWRVNVSNPVSDVDAPRKPPHRYRRITDAERDAIIDKLGWNTAKPPLDKRDWAAWVFSFALETAMRQGEILNFVWGGVHIAERYVHLPRAITKTNRDRDVPLSPGAVALLKMLTPGRADERVAKMNSGTLGVYFREAVKAAGIVGMTFHDSRHEAITRMSKKLTLLELTRVSGHSDPRNLMSYFNPTASDIAGRLD